jgi:hypothetical protein
LPIQFILSRLKRARIHPPTTKEPPTIEAIFTVSIQ